MVFNATFNNISVISWRFFSLENSLWWYDYAQLLCNWGPIYWHHRWRLHNVLPFLITIYNWSNIVFICGNCSSQRPRELYLTRQHYWKIAQSILNEVDINIMQEYIFHRYSAREKLLYTDSIPATRHIHPFAKIKPTLLINSKH